MEKIEYLDPEIANEGQSVNNWTPGEWVNVVPEEGDWRPSVPNKFVPSYDQLREHKHYGRYFAPHIFRPFPAWMYHPTLPSKIVKTKEEVIALGPEWATTPFAKSEPVMVGKSLPVKSEQSKLTEAISAAMLQQHKQVAPGAIDPNLIAMVVAGVMQAMAKNQAPPMPTETPNKETGPTVAEVLARKEPEEDGHDITDGAVERAALIELAEKEGVKIDKRWSNDRMKEALGL